jgi:hypothetical protein
MMKITSTTIFEQKKDDVQTGTTSNRVGQKDLSYGNGIPIKL